jgi:hypothetical protein
MSEFRSFSTQSAGSGSSLHLRGLWANLEEAAVHMAVELKNAAFDLMAAESLYRRFLSL